MEYEFLSFLNNYKYILGNNQGISDGDIASIETEYNVILPLFYKEFLLHFGKSSGNLLSSYLMTSNNICRNFKVVEFNLIHTIHSNTFKIESDMFFFGQWQGDAFYFHCNNVIDPPVYFLQDFDEYIIYKNKFSDFIKEEGLQPLIDLDRNSQ